MPTSISAGALTSLVAGAGSRKRQALRPIWKTVVSRT